MDGERFRGALERARGALRDGDFEAAERAAREAAAIDPRAAAASHLMAHATHARGRAADALRHIRRAMALDGDDPDIHADGAAIMNGQGLWAEAEAACRRALASRARHTGALNNLAVALDNQGRLDDALAASDRALSADPDFVDAMVNKGRILVGLGRTAEAVEVLRVAAAQAPDNALATLNLAEAYRRGGDLDRALARYDRLVSGRPDLLAARLNRAGLLHKLGRDREAMAGYAAIIEDFGAVPEAHAGLGVAHLTAGDTEHAVAAFRQAVTLDPGHGRAWAALAAAPGVHLSDADMATLARLVDDVEAASEHRIAAHFALADSFDVRAEFRAAFAHYRAGNDARKTELARAGHIFDDAAWQAEVSAIIDAHPSDPATDAGNPDTRPVFVVGMPRSGTTLVEQILASHPGAAGIGEALSISSLPRDMAPAEKTAAVTRRFDALAPGAERVVDKTPFHFLHIGTIRALFPGAHIIHCVRDPMDVGLSCYMQNFVEAYPWSCDLGHIGAYISGHARLMAHWRALLGAALHEVVHEDLVAEPEAGMRRLVAAVGLDWHPACLEFHRGRRDVRSASNWRVRQPIDGSSIGRAENYAEDLGPLRDALD